MSSSSVVRPGRSCERCHAVKLTFVILSLVCATPACAAPTTTLVARDGSGDRANAGPGAVAVWVRLRTLPSIDLSGGACSYMTLCSSGRRFALMPSDYEALPMLRWLQTVDDSNLQTSEHGI
ncbi:hypothetical protein C8Q72DRAFT_631628 [Fomitopsis betulina]|nr:hypothetical protein C8Q72DRAFT_631628 [Fomitopsis betulina]